MIYTKERRVTGVPFLLRAEELNSSIALPAS